MAHAENFPGSATLPRRVRALGTIAIVVALSACPRAQPSPTVEPAATVTTPADPPAPIVPGPATPALTPPPDPPPVDRLVAVRFASRDPELAYFASLVAPMQESLTACADAELRADADIRGFVRVTFDHAVARDAGDTITPVPVVAGIGSTALHTCVATSLSGLRIPTRLARGRRDRVAFSVDLRIGARDPTRVIEPDRGDVLVLDEAGDCTWLHENPCAPNKSCMGPERRPTRCPVGWGPPPRSNAADLAHRMLYYARSCADAPDATCTLMLERTGDACEARLRSNRDDQPIVVAMACVDLERLWQFSTRRSLPSAKRTGSGDPPGVSLGANHIEPGWSAYRAKGWQWRASDPVHPEVAFFAWLLLDRAAALGLPVATRLGFVADEPPPPTPKQWPPRD